ncbi:MAG: LysM peptidoglycan-binding domain-containing protein [Acidobacteriota bacterium]
MPTRRRAFLPLALCPLFFLVANPLAAQENSSRPGNYVVRPGDTLEGIAQRFLGSSERWRDLWQLNREQVTDPNRISPGWKLQIVWQDLPDDSSVLSKTWNRVENLRPPREGWEDAALNDVLRTRDRLQTFRSSSAELTFPDETVLRLSEDTLLLLEATGRLGSTVERDQVQLLEGQADLEGSGLDQAAASGGSGIELVIGEAVAAPQADDSGEVKARARLAEDAKAQLMVYAGESDLEAGGESVRVETGMGSSVTPGEAPSPPEKLLEAPALESPEAGSGLSTPRPSFSWAAVTGAASYTLELCRDPACGLLERRIADLQDAAWQPQDPLAKIALFWRVTAVSSTGLDGFPSESRAFEVLSGREDSTLPAVAFRVFPPRLAPRWGLNERWILGPGARLEAVAEDAESGVESWTPLLNGERAEAEIWQNGPWPEGEPQLASFIAVDRAGNESRLDPIPFVFDGTPPAYTWGLEGEPALGELSTVPAGDFGNLPQHVARRFVEVPDPHRWWSPWRRQRWTVDLDGRQVVLRPNRSVRVDFAGREVVLSPDRGLWILAEDEICDSIFRLDYDLDLSREGRWPRKRSVLKLYLEAWDWVDNKSRSEMTLTTLGRR